MPFDQDIVVVSGLPRSGTSLMMQMLDRGGLPALTDAVRAADTDNPRGYYEFEPVKRTRQDPSWLPRARGRVVKLVSSLLYDLPASESYRVVFMQRDFDEMLESQERMLDRLGQSKAPRPAMKSAFGVHLDKLFSWLPQQRHLRVLTVSYNELLADPPRHAADVAAFLDGRVDTPRMLEAIDPALYRNRRAAAPTGESG